MHNEQRLWILVQALLKCSRQYCHTKIYTVKKFTKESLGDLARGIKQLLLEDRCSFSEKELVLLNDCIEIIEIMISKPEDRDRELDLYDASRLVELLMHVFLIVHHS